MHQVLKAIVQDVRSRAASNPADEAVSDGTDLSLEILRSGRIQEFDESDLLEAARKVGMDDSEAVAWLESLASWWV